MSERGSGLGPFLLGVLLGAVAGVLFAPASGEVTRRRIGRRVGDLKDLAEEKLEALGTGGADDEPAEAEEPSTRQELERRLREARRRRRIERAARDRAATLEEDDEPVA